MFPSILQDIHVPNTLQDIHVPKDRNYTTYYRTSMFPSELQVLWMC
jgi:hypothetical protein